MQSRSGSQCNADRAQDDPETVMTKTDLMEILKSRGDVEDAEKLHQPPQPTPLRQYCRPGKGPKTLKDKLVSTNIYELHITPLRHTTNYLKHSEGACVYGTFAPAFIASGLRD